MPATSNNFTIESFSLLDLIKSADLITITILGLLFLFSIFSWCIIFGKILYYRAITKRLNLYQASSYWHNIVDKLQSNITINMDVIDNEDLLYGILIAGNSEYHYSKDFKEIADSYTKEAVKASIKDRILQAMYIVRDKKIQTIENNLNFLAIIGSTSPFIGLLGTVWGIMNSFQNIATAKSNSISVIAPGIAEALVATAIGLMASIPAVIFYNLFISHVENIQLKIDNEISKFYIYIARIMDKNI